MSVGMGVNVLLSQLPSQPPQELQASTRLPNRGSRRAQVSRRFRPRKDTKGTLLEVLDLAQEVIGSGCLSSFTRLHQLIDLGLADDVSVDEE